MKKRFFIILFMICLFIFCNINASANIGYKEVETDIPPKMLFLGDSIVTGFGLEGYNKGKDNCNSYANQLKVKYSKLLDGNCETSMENLAIDGQTSEQLLKDLLKGVYDEKLNNVDAIILSIGGNDLLTVIWNFIANNFNINSDANDNSDSENEFNFQQLIQATLSLNSEIDNNLSEFNINISEIAKYIKGKTDAVLIIQTLYNPFDQLGQNQAKELIDEKIKKLNSYIQAHKSGENAEYLIADVYSEFYGKGNELTRIQEMDIHPNQEGHNVISNCIDKTIRTQKYSYLTQNNENQPAQSNNVSQNKTEYIIWVAGGLIGVALISFAFMAFKIFKKKEL